MNPLRRLIPPLIILIVVITIVIFGFMIVERWSFIEALYMVVITLSTVGFKEVREPSVFGMGLIMFMIVFGVGTMAYTVGQVIEMMVEGQIIGFRRRVRMEKLISSLKDHYIICGFGRVGHQVAEELKIEKIPFVVIDTKNETAEELSQANIPHIIGDVTTDENLLNAGIKVAKGLIACADSDVANVFVTLSARSLNQDLIIIGRASGEEAEQKLKKAGADRVISPYLIAGRRMASVATKPVASDFLDTIMHAGHIELQIREEEIDRGSHFTGKSLSEADIKKRSGATVLAIRKSNGKFNLKPDASTIISEGDILVTLGAPEQLDQLQRML